MNIRTRTQVPSVYSSRSRDFQLLSCILDLVFNSSKNYSDMISSMTLHNHVDTKLLDLLSKTVGFDVKRVYDANDLYTLCSTFKSIIKEKGTKKSIEDCVRVLLKAQNINKDFEVVIDNDYDAETSEGYTVSIFIPKELKDIALLEDMLDYVLPTGYTFSIAVMSFVEGFGKNKVYANISDTDIKYNQYKNKDLGKVLAISDDVNKSLWGYDFTDSDTDMSKYQTENSVVYKDEEN